MLLSLWDVLKGPRTSLFSERFLWECSWVDLSLRSFLAICSYDRDEFSVITLGIIGVALRSSLCYSGLSSGLSLYLKCSLMCAFSKALKTSTPLPSFCSAVILSSQGCFRIYPTPSLCSFSGGPSLASASFAASGTGGHSRLSIRWIKSLQPHERSSSSRYLLAVISSPSFRNCSSSLRKLPSRSLTTPLNGR